MTRLARSTAAIRSTAVTHHHHNSCMLSTLCRSTCLKTQRLSLPPSHHFSTPALLSLRRRAPVRLHPVSATLSVPPAIPRPPYARPGRSWLSADPQQTMHKDHIEIKDTVAQQKMRVSCRYASYLREYAGSLLCVGRTTDEVDRLLHAECMRLNVYPSPLHYADFPKSLCTSINEVVCHGIPDARPLQSGDIVNTDVSVYIDGYHGDCSAMWCVGEVDEEGQKLCAAVKRAVALAVSVCAPGVPFSAIGTACQQVADESGYTVVEAFTGHGIGTEFHLPPHVFHHRRTAADLQEKGDPIMQEGMVFTIEPQFNEGSKDVYLLDDGWTVVTRDGGRSAQHEETVLITATGAEVLTRHDNKDIAAMSQCL